MGERELVVAVETDVDEILAGLKDLNDVVSAEGGLAAIIKKLMEVRHG